jgi:[ribosomal protein S5]-alanine N-acetyltransferase
MAMSFGFKTQRLWLRPVVETDLLMLHQIFIDPYVRRYLCDNEEWSLAQVEEMLKQSLSSFAKHQFGLWLVERKVEQDVIGFVGLWYFFGEAQPQLAYALLPYATKQGYATEASRRILDYALIDLGYSYLDVSSDRSNIQSHRVAERLGMHQREERQINGNPTTFFRIGQE